jgi:polyhydroxybutyrate depolymerase
MIKKTMIVLGVISAGLVVAYFFLLHVSFAPQPTLSGQLKTTSLPIDGHNRNFSYYLPANIDSDRPLIFALHGSMGSGDDMRRLTAYQFDQIADNDNIIAVYPDGYKNHWNGCRASASYAANVDDIDDMAFFEAMINYFAEQYQIDRSRIYATGFSNGGHMVYRLALEKPEAFAALAVIGANLPVDENFNCQKSDKPVSIAIINGTEDPINPYHGGLVSLAGNTSRGIVMSSSESAEYFYQLFASHQTSAQQQMPQLDDNAASSIIVNHWRGNAGRQVRLYTLQGAGHVVPSSQVRYGSLHKQAADMDTAIILWDFFRSASFDGK